VIRVGLALGASWLGGINYSRNLLNAIFALPDRQIEPVLLVGDRVDGDILGGFPPVEVIRSGWFDRLTPRWLGRRVWQQVFASDPFLERFLRSHQIAVLSHAGVLGSHSTIPAVCWIVDFQHRQLPQFFTASERWYRDQNFRLQCDHATRIILSSEDAQNALAAFGPSCVEKSRILRFVAQPGLGGQPTSLKALQDRYGFAGAYFHVPNQFWSHKNHRLILDALAMLKRRGESPLVISTGATEDYRQPRYFGELMAQAEALGVLDSFRVLGVIPSDDLVGLMLNAVALINPSRSEGWSTSVEEAKSLGKRIILSDLAVHREQAPPDGVYIDPDDSVALADSMELILATLDPAAERLRKARAKRELPVRVRDFAETYQDIILEVQRERLRIIKRSARSRPRRLAIRTSLGAPEVLRRTPDSRRKVAVGTGVDDRSSGLRPPVKAVLDPETKLVFITESPTPYSTPILNELASRLRLHVVYLDRGRSAGKGHALWSDFDDPWGQKPEFDHTFLPSLQFRLGMADFHTQMTAGSSFVLRRLKPDVLVVHSWGPPMVEPLLWARSTGRPSVMWVESTRDSGLLRGRLPTRVRRVIVGLADSYVSNGRSATDFALGLGAEQSEISTSCLPSLLAQRLEATPFPEKTAGSPTKFLFVGRLVDLKRPVELAHAFLSAPELTGSTLTMVGDGPLRETLQNMPAAGGRIQLPGRLAGDSLMQAYLDADVLVAPSYREVWGLVVNEALAAGLHVIASDRVGSTHDLLDRDSGVVVGADDDAALGRAMVAATQASQSLSARQLRRNRVSGCTAERFADDLVTAASRALNMHGRNTTTEEESDESVDGE
jgi:glycosyltransferase involved in cell wall biosynthesis